MGESSFQLNVGTGGDKSAAYQDASGNKHQEVVIQTQSGSSDPVTVNSTNPMPVSASGPVASGATNAGNPVKVAGAFNTSPPTLTNGQLGDMQLDSSGNLKVNIAAGAAAGGTSSTFGAATPAIGTAAGASDGTNLQPLKVDGSGNLKVNVAAGSVPAGQDNTAFTAGTTQGLPGMGVYNDGASALTSGNMGVPRLTSARQAITVQHAAQNGGYSPAKLISAASTNATSIKGSAGQLGYIVAHNINAAPRFLKLYNKASAPTVGTDTPVHTFPIPGNTAGAGFVIPVPAGMQFTTGIALAITANVGDSDNTAIAANEVVINYGYA